MADINFDCTACGQNLDAPESFAAYVIRCPACEDEVTVPGDPVVQDPNPEADADPDQTIVAAPTGKKRVVRTRRAGSTTGARRTTGSASGTQRRTTGAQRTGAAARRTRSSRAGSAARAAATSDAADEAVALGEASRVGFGRRLGALMLDSVFLSVILSVVFGILTAIGVGGAASGMAEMDGSMVTMTESESFEVEGGSIDAEDGSVEAGEIEFDLAPEAVGIMALLGVLAGIGGILVLAISLLYPLIEIITGASPGKKVLGIIIRNADAGKAGFGKLLLRYIVRGVLGIICVFTVFSASKQGVHDKICGTAVFHKKDLAA